METRICTECGQEKAASDFSKSYPNRCRECVAKAARDRRKAGKEKSTELELPALFPQDRPQGPDWEARHYDLALRLFQAYMGPEPGAYMTPAQAALAAKDAADKFINIMRDNNQ